MASELTNRTAFAVVAAPVAIAVIWYGGLALALLLAAVSAIGAWELYRIAVAGGVRPLSWIGIALSAAVPLLVHLAHVGQTAPPVSFALLVVLALAGASVWLRGVDGRPLAATAITVFGVLYTGAMLSFGYALRYHEYAGYGRAGGTALVMMPLLLTWSSDTGAYFVGRAMGRHKLIPSVSPGKTVEGAIGGMVLTVIVCWLFERFALRPYAELGLRAASVVLFGVAISVTAQLGDLVESLFKREAGVKDSSRIIPGHGGILDRFDSLLFVLPVAYVLLSYLLIVAPR